MARIQDNSKTRRVAESSSSPAVTVPSLSPDQLTGERTNTMDTNNQTAASIAAEEEANAPLIVGSVQAPDDPQATDYPASVRRSRTLAEVLADNPIYDLPRHFIDMVTLLRRTPAMEDAREETYDYMPGLDGPGKWDEACAAFGMALFGREVIPEVDADYHGSRCQVAFQIARAYLSLPDNHPAELAFEILALFAYSVIPEPEEEQQETPA